MTLATEAVTSAGSGLTFINSYSSTVTDAYRGAVISAENFLQSHFTNTVTISVSFDFQPLASTTAGQNSFSTVSVSYNSLVAALRAHETTIDDITAVNRLPTVDPSNGVGFELARPEAIVLGLASQSNVIDDHVTLNSSLPFTFGQDAIGVIEHEITEGAFGRIASLGLQSAQWAPLDLFRFNAAGQHDYTGGADGQTTYFGISGTQLSSLTFHNSISASGVDDGQDLGDWSGVRGDAFGSGGPASPGSVSTTDLQVLDVLGWNPASTGTPYSAPADDYASSLSDISHPFGQIAVGGTVNAALQTAGDRDWFQVTLQGGATYSITETGHASGGGTLGDPYLRLHDASGAEIAANDDIVSGSNPDSRISFTAPTTGTYYVDAGAFVDGYAGTYRLTLTQTGGATTTVTGTSGDDVLTGPGNSTISGGLGDDTITGVSGSNVLRGNEGDDVINGGTGFDDINGNQGNDTIHGNAGDDWVVGGKNDDQLFGDAGDDIVWGNLGNDTLDGGTGNDQVRGGQGDDALTGGAGDDWLSGDRGSDTITGGAGADTFHSSSGAGLDLVTDFSLSQGDRVQLDPGTTYTASQVGADTVVDMGNGDQVVLKGVLFSSLTPGWIFVG